MLTSNNKGFPKAFAFLKYKKNLLTLKFVFSFIQNNSKQFSINQFILYKLVIYKAFAPSLWFDTRTFEILYYNLAAYTWMFTIALFFAHQIL